MTKKITCKLICKWCIALREVVHIFNVDLLKSRQHLMGGQSGFALSRGRWKHSSHRKNVKMCVAVIAFEAILRRLAPNHKATARCLCSSCESFARQTWDLTDGYPSLTPDRDNLLVDCMWILRLPWGCLAAVQPLKLHEIRKERVNVKKLVCDVENS